jgi:hypothetical protein
LPSRVVRSAVALPGRQVGGEAGAGQAVGVEVDGQHVEPVGEQPLGDGAADAAGGARHQRGARHR